MVRLTFGLYPYNCDIHEYFNGTSDKINEKYAHVLNNLVKNEYDFMIQEIDGENGMDFIHVPKIWTLHTVGYIRGRFDDISNIVRDIEYSRHLGIQANLLDFEELYNHVHMISRRTEGQENIPMQSMMLDYVSRLARSIQSIYNTPASSYPQIWIRFNIIDINAHKYYRMIRDICGYNSHICVALDINAEWQDDSLIERWYAEPVKCLIIHTDCNNHFNYYENLKQSFNTYNSLQVLLEKFPNIVFQDASNFHEMTRIEVPLDLGNVNSAPSLMGYIRRLYQSWKTVSLLESEFKDDYEDYLQVPLQPLKDDLDSETYQTFEKDPIKYAAYEAAIRKAIDKVMSTIDITDPTSVIKVTVFGAGRGPLVGRTIQAARKSSIDNNKIRIIAIEKNRNAVLTLQQRIKNDIDWKDAFITIKEVDMRDWVPLDEEKADIIVSELLGSWGCNELSPECLYGAEKALKKDGISIPTSYTSYLAPISSTKLWARARAMRPQVDVEAGLPHPAGLETPYVVHMVNYLELAPNQPCFTFYHPSDIVDKSGEAKVKVAKQLDENTTYCQLTFDTDEFTTLHGFQGTFESCLYDDVIISIRPENHSIGMFSWFPMFIPLTTPITIGSPKDSSDKVTVSVWRCSDKHKVWYEWALVEPTTSAIQNQGGRAYNILL